MYGGIIMTDVRVDVQETVCEFPEFHELDVYQYFTKFGDNCDTLYIKLPESKTFETKCSFNAYNINTNCISYIEPNTKCCRIDKVRVII